MAVRLFSSRILAGKVGIFLLALILPIHALVPNPGQREICVFACYDWTDHITWDLPPELANSDDYYYALCASTLKIKSIFYCSQAYCSSNEIESGLGLLNRTCIEEAGVQLPSFESIALTPDELAGLQRVPRKGSEEATAKNPVAQPLIPDRSYWALSVRTDKDFYRNIAWSWDFSYASYGFWAIVLVVGMIARAVQLFREIRRHSQTDSSRELISKQSSAWGWIRRTLILPATFRERCQYPIGWCTIPPRWETLILVSYLVFNVVVCFVGYDTFDDNLFFGAPSVQLSRYVSDRTGILATANLPLMWLFAARNNPFIWLTGWSFATFNNFHRWIGRLAFVLAFIHSVGWSINFYQYGGAAGYTAEWAYRYFWCGAIATTVMSLMVGLSFYGFRNRRYDFFLVCHIVLAIVFLVTMWYHLEIMSGQYNGFIWPVVAFWASDRLVRYSRILISSVLSRSAKSMKAVAKYDINADIVRLDVTNLLGNAAITPGYYYYVYTPSDLRGYESHPFTLCSWTASSAANEPGKGGASITAEESKVEPGALGQSKHSFLIRPYSGYTARLRNAALSSGDSQTRVEQLVFLEGPYGNNIDLARYSNVLVIAGGSGISIAVSHAYHLLATSNGPLLHVVWAVPQKSLLDSLCANELAAVLDHERFQMTVYVTNEAEPDDIKASAQTGSSTQFGRPDVYHVMREARVACSKDLAIVTCGTPGMADTCRAAIVRLLEEDGADVAYHNETMTW